MQYIGTVLNPNLIKPIKDESEFESTLYSSAVQIQPICITSQNGMYMLIIEWAKSTIPSFEVAPQCLFFFFYV